MQDLTLKCYFDNCNGGGGRIQFNLMLFLLIISFFAGIRASWSGLWPSLTRATIEWRSYSPKYVERTSVATQLLVPISVASEEAYVQMPMDHFGEYAEPAKIITIRIRRWRRTQSSEQHLWIVPGGPGEHANVVEAAMNQYHRFIPESAWIYTADHRGTSKHSK